MARYNALRAETEHLFALVSVAFRAVLRGNSYVFKTQPMAVDTSLVLCYYPSVMKKHIDFIILIVMAACLLITGCGAEEAPVSFETTTVGDSSEAPRTTPSQAEQTTLPH